MDLAAVFHRPKQNWASAYDNNTLELRLRTKRGDMNTVYVLAGDKYDWSGTRWLQPMHLLASDLQFDYWQAFVKPPFRRLRYCFVMDDGHEKVWMTEHGFKKDEPEPDNLNSCFDFPYIHPADVFSPPEWVKDAVFYQIFPERFANGDPSNDPAGTEPWGGTPTTGNFFGGDLQGVIDHLDHLSELGVNAIYFTPVFEAPTNHKYDTRDYLKVDPHFGTNETLKRLVDACHARGIRVLLDAVFNHAGGTFPPFLDCKEKGADSRYAGWFHVREWPLSVKDSIPTYETFAFEPTMPKLNTENPEVKSYLLEVAEYWIKEIGIDGWRLDVANEVDHHFWREFRQTVKSLNPDAYILGEIWHDSMMWLQGDQFDAVMNYPFTASVLDFFVKNKSDAKDFADKIGSLIASYPTKVNEVAFNLLDSHDTPRLLTLCEHNKKRMKLAAVVQFTFIGTPCIYYGDEVGLDGNYDPECRKCMVWDEDGQDRNLFSHYRSLIALRKQHPALRTGQFRVLLAERGGSMLAYERHDENERFIVILNNSKKTRKAAFEIIPGQWKNAITGETLSCPKGKIDIRLKAYDFMILRHESRP